ncbi:MAG: winged helix-turn-helix domain-containing protein, partial [Candidatus Binatia bacterium]
MKRRPRPEVVLRLKLRGEVLLGPGRADLLERIGRLGSIAAAARDMGMSYRRAWLLLDSLNRLFARPVVETAHGGHRRGGAVLTSVGRAALAAYRR